MQLPGDVLVEFLVERAPTGSGVVMCHSCLDFCAIWIVCLLNFLPSFHTYSFTSRLIYPLLPE